jgi:type II secretory pathway pseudopilin PulG
MPGSPGFFPRLGMKKTSGFTLSEAAVAIAVVAILSAILIPLVERVIRNARIARAKADLKVIAGAIALQLKDTACRPRHLTNRGNGLAYGGIWYSAGNDIRIYWQQHNHLQPGPQWLPQPSPRPNQFNNTFLNLFAPGPDDPPAFQTAKDLFVYRNLQHWVPNGYRGPYLSRQMAEKTDPWGRRYLIFGYGRGCETTQGPIYVVCAGESGGIILDNLRGLLAWEPFGPGGNRAGTWSYEGPSATNLVVQVH